MNYLFFFFGDLSSLYLNKVGLGFFSLLYYSFNIKDIKDSCSGQEQWMV